MRRFAYPVTVSTRTAKKPAGRSSSRAAARRSDEKGPVKTWIAALKPGHRAIAKKVHALIHKTVPEVRSAVKWRQAFYGVEGKGWIVAMSSYADYVSLTFFAGTKLNPVPPLGEHPMGRRTNIHDLSEFDETRLRSWFEQAASIQGWGTVR